jgi:hypothetical protein
MFPTKLTDDGRRTPSDGKSSYCLWQGLLKKNIKMWIRYQSWPPQAILVSDWPILKKYSPLEPLGQNLVGSIYGMSSVNNRSGRNEQSS